MNNEESCIIRTRSRVENPHRRQMYSEDSELELDVRVETAVFVFLVTFCIALSPRLCYLPGTRSRSSVSYEALTERKVPCAPNRAVFLLLGFVYYSTAALAMVFVRLEGGPYVREVNRQPMIEYWLLQLLLAFYFLLFFYYSRWLFGLLSLLSACIVCALDALFFARVSDVAGVLMFVFLSWPLGLLVFSLVIVSKNSDRAVQRHTRLLTGRSNGAQKLRVSEV